MTNVLTKKNLLDFYKANQKIRDTFFTHFTVKRHIFPLIRDSCSQLLKEKVMRILLLLKFIKQVGLTLLIPLTDPQIQMIKPMHKA